MDKPYGPNEPNSTHQWWSKWVVIVVGGKTPPTTDVVDALRRWAKQVWRTTVGRVRVDRLGGAYRLCAEVEGLPVHDGDLTERLKSQFAERFVIAGFGPDAVATFEVALIAGSRQDGSATEQLVVLPSWDDVCVAQWGPHRADWPVNQPHG